MKTTFPATVAIMFVLCVNLLLAAPKCADAEPEKPSALYAQSSADALQQQIVSKEREELECLGAPKYAAAELEKPSALYARSSADALQQQIVSKEREELECLKTGDLKHFAALLADDAVFVDDHGAASKAEIVEHTAQFRLTEYTIDDVKFVPLSTTSGLISHKIRESGNAHGKEFTAQVYVSALWAERGGNLVCVFSQETAAK